ncbi:MAG: hypothetical protein ABJD13_12700 [Paracoccaceae bacterium]
MNRSGGFGKADLMVESRSSFDSRLRTLGRKHKAMTHGSVVQMRGDGLVLQKPKSYRARRGFPLRGLVLLMLGFFAFKGYMITNIGAEGYDQRIQALAAGTPIEQVGAKVMQADPVTAMLTDAFGKVADRI